MIRIAIAEDDPQCFAQLEQFISDYGRETGRAFQVTHYGDGEDLVERYKPGFDLILMDVEMPFMDGMTAAGYIREKDPEVVIVFVTNLAQYAIQGYEVAASDFIVKPVAYPEFALKFTKVLARLEHVMPPDVLIRTDTSFVRLSPRDIRYVEVKGHHCVYHTTSGEYRQYQTMKSAESALIEQGFVRCNSFLLVNLAHVDRIDGMNVIVGGQPLQISHPKRKAFTDAFVRFMETQRYE